MVEVPDVTPETIPELVPIVATLVLLLIHVPPPVLERVVVEPAQTVAVPVIADGNGFTVTTVVVIQPVASV